MRRVHQCVAALKILIAHPVFNLLADNAALGMEEDQPWPGEFLDAEQIQFLADLAVVAFLRFLNAGEIGVQIFLREERRSCNALQLRVLVVALPIGS